MKIKAMLVGLIATQSLVSISFAAEQYSAYERSVTTEEETIVEEKDGLDDQIVGITLQAGMINVEDAGGDSNTRGVAGLSVDGNFLAGVPTRTGKPFFGPSIGVFYSHLGQPGANFFGLNSPGGDEGADLLFIPLNLKAGYTFSDVVRLSAHGGVSIDYINSARRVGVGGVTVATFRDDDWDTNPNVGADVEIGLGQDVLFLIRPDWTFREAGTAFTGTLGIGFPLS